MCIRFSTLYVKSIISLSKQGLCLVKNALAPSWRVVIFCDAKLEQQCAEYETTALETIESSYELFTGSFLKPELILMKEALENYDLEATQAVIEKIWAWMTTT